MNNTDQQLMSEEEKEIVSISQRELQERNNDLERRIGALAEREQRYHKMMEEVQDYAIIFLDKEGMIVSWNKGAERIKGYKEHEIVGKNFRLFYTEKDNQDNMPENLMNAAIRDGRASAEGWRVRKDGTLFWGNVVITAIHNDEGGIIGFTKVTRDLTERKSAEDNQLNYAKELEHKCEELEQINQELESFSYIASHDLQEPLRKIRSYSSLILEKEAGKFSDSGKEHFRRMSSAAERMQRLIEDLLSFSRTSTAYKEFEEVDLNALLRESLSTLKVSIEESSAVISSETLPVVKVIRFQFVQLLQNLISNSIKYKRNDVSPEISISSKVVKGSTIPDARAIGDTDYIELTVADNGIGFEPQYATKIFELFQRLHGQSEYSGTGIGLAICKKIVRNHHGFIIASGEPGKGSIFTVYIPA